MTPTGKQKTSGKPESLGEPAAASEEAFQFQGRFLRAAKKEIRKYPPGRQASAVLALLDLAQRQNSEGHYVTPAAMRTIATMTGMPELRVFEVASFYTMIRTRPVGKYLLQLCGTTPCMLRGAQELMGLLQQTLGIQSGETTPDGLFTLMEVECLGACVNAPVLQVNDDFYEDLNPETTRALLEGLRKGVRVKPGPQIERHFSAPADLPADLGDLVPPDVSPGGSHDGRGRDKEARET